MLMDVLIWIAYFLVLYSIIYWVIMHLEGVAMENKLPKKKTPKTYPTLSVIVPAYNEEKTLQNTLESLLALDYPKNKLRIVVVNDGSTDNTKNVADTYANKHKHIHVIHQPNQGKAAALNNALKTTKSTYFACLDADSFVHPRAAKEMVHAFTADKQLEIGTPVMLIQEPKTWIQKFQRLEYLAAMLLVRLMAAIDSNYVAPGPFSMYRTQTIKQLGGFDTTSLVEDQEIAYRIQEKHGRIRQIPKANVETIGPNNFRKLRRQRNRWMKGSLENIIKYRHLLFNKEYGDLGSFMMPLTLSSFFLAVVAVTAFAYYMIRPFFLWMRDLYLIGFDIRTLINNWQWNYTLLDPAYTTLYIMGLMLFIGMFILYLSSRTYDKNIREYGSIYILPYFFVYFLILAYISTEVLIEMAVGKKRRW